MTALSLRAGVARLEQTTKLEEDVALPPLDPSLGLRLHPFYRAPTTASAFPYTSVRTLGEACSWPTTFAPLEDHPKDRTFGLGQDTQGVTHDDTSWYFTRFGQHQCLFKIPATANLNDGGAAADALTGCMPPLLAARGYNHCGDIDFHGDKQTPDGLLYVPIEIDGQSHIPVVALFDRELNYVASAPLHEEQADHAPWCAVNPLNGRLYSSLFDNISDVFVYERRLELNHGHVEHFSLPLIGRFPLSESIDRVQGGVFSRLGHLYLTTDVDGGGIAAFDMLSGRRVPGFQVEFDRSWTVQQELEGLTIWDLDTVPHQDQVNGQFHVLLVDNDVEVDDFYFKHYTVPPAQRAAI